MSTPSLFYFLNILNYSRAKAVPLNVAIFHLVGVTIPFNWSYFGWFQCYSKSL